MSFARPVTLTLRFLLELCALAAFAYWGWQTGATLPWKVAAGVGAPLVAAAVWGLFVSPKATIVVPREVRLIIEVAFFALAVLALYAAGQTSLALALAGFYILHRILLFAVDR
jgi:hypothetical protein